MAKLQSEATKAVASCAGSGWRNPNFGILTLLVLLIAVAQASNGGRLKMKNRFFVLVGASLLSVYSIYAFNHQKSLPSCVQTQGSLSPQDEKMIHLLRMVDTLGLDEVKKLAEDYLHPSNSSGNAQKTKSEKFSLLQLHRFDPFVFARDHKADCQRRLQLSELTSEDKAQAGLTPEQAIERYKGKLPTWEIKEISSKKFPRIFFAGEGANKTHMLPMNLTNNFGFDEPSETENKGKYRWKIGDHLAYRYELLKYLGGGTYGEVLKARDHMLEKDVAIKVLNNYTSIAKHTMVEYNIISKINKAFPHSPFFIVNIDNFKFRNHFCMVFELLGKTAYDVYETEAFRKNTELFKSYVSDLLKGLVLIHSLDILHNDLKPDNLLSPLERIDNEPRIRIMDFGLSCVLGSSKDRCPSYYVQTRYYRSPEVMLAMNYTTQSDMWSMGVIIGEMFRGSEFIFGETEPDQMASIMENIGLPPVPFIEKGVRKRIYYEGVHYKTEKGFQRRPYRKSIPKTLGLISPDDDLFHDFLRRLLQWEPDKRMTAAEALNHPWLTGIDEDMRRIPAL
ncbi:Oidioi.mRNA.OKI2018_I69.XSR.g14252.t1.cds [Oikopleura dioica]|uniref:dual-specificity kinase n=1 Tax=Oikopleura dioica TaxID=34765 RepID=A0ABN7S983_OIKDI|nr:Oidioi.mRNA.OKI2018_I69.XSR.g14252.t1.cds [Oikopleura dioica]